jgi:hypothetical protein
MDVPGHSGKIISNGRGPYPDPALRQAKVFQHIEGIQRDERIPSSAIGNGRFFSPGAA